MKEMTYRQKWELKNLKSYTFKLHKTNDKDVVDYLATKPNIRQYIIGLIRKDMNEQTPESDKSEI